MENRLHGVSISMATRIKPGLALRVRGMFVMN